MKKKNKKRPTCITVNCTAEFKRRFRAFSALNHRSANAQAILVMCAAMEAAEAAAKDEAAKEA